MYFDAKVALLVARGCEKHNHRFERIGSNWGRCEGRDEEVKSAIGEVMAEEMEELFSVFVDANRLRSVQPTNVYEAAL